MGSMLRGDTHGEEPARRGAYTERREGKDRKGSHNWADDTERRLYGKGTTRRHKNKAHAWWCYSSIYLYTTARADV